MSRKFSLRKFFGNRGFLDYSPEAFWGTRRSGRGYDNAVWHNDFVSFLKKNECKSVLELGCGTGVNLAHVKSKISSMNCFGFDLSKYHIDLGKKKYDGIDIKVGLLKNALKEFEENSFDCVLCAGLLMHVLPREINFVIENIKRISSNGIFIFEQYKRKEFGLRHSNNFVFYYDYELLFCDLNKTFQKYYELDYLGAGFTLKKEAKKEL